MKLQYREISFQIFLYNIVYIQYCYTVGEREISFKIFLCNIYVWYCYRWTTEQSLSRSFSVYTLFTIHMEPFQVKLLKNIFPGLTVQYCIIVDTLYTLIFWAPYAQAKTMLRRLARKSCVYTYSSRWLCWHSVHSVNDFVDTCKRISVRKQKSARNCS